ncbi:hypothetical protein A2291_05140 [candidate division WOR-1 bacterium RIFOXYB2_FULL_42_35]|uniref:Uncharacterized protein n=1 Tax=candidate division WOR-1 bacterium RIFOXYC2_FULL_41_25 TaxID=1802586 RepID=A0A1F4TN00_UNCSA|nr:MAG: hypothetical protein A2247_00560 [candidate division WOR-1 bacterium RIFOXYA2_FULL_41_14]OGC24485.1 MAG: hypothetical protein A2291_05140 [candidate division WOR-1 bacterium RIFOXYB2_FULL_42_35]OGC34102.1 MAG: hypothetical protein A2462_01000 [candidate division WOR-1 bacterium RIFOXYC2_FULL_41_25]OGC42798.1 MAG: hypothetical protein A2548_00615 [candidate division WOR-1 bacterium RIFOXYD2_FULL_41_8]
MRVPAYKDQPLNPAPNAAAARIQAAIARAHKMFMVYGSLLTDYGRKSAGVIEPAFSALEQGDYNSPLLLQAERQVLAVWPKPDDLSITEHGLLNWYNWFKTYDINDGIRIGGIGLGQGCLLPCHHCFEGVGSKESRSVPLFAAIKKLLVDYRATGGPMYFDVPRKISLLDWYDPFLGFSAADLVDFSFRVSPYKSLPKVTVYLKAWDENDIRTQRGAYKLVNELQKLPDGLRNVRISFHLCSSRPDLDLVSALYNYKTGQDQKALDKLAIAYGLSYGNVFLVFNELIDSIVAYSSIYAKSDDDENNFHINRILEENTLKALLAALNHSGVNMTALESCVRHQQIFLRGRGADFWQRLSLAWQNDDRCLSADQTAISDHIIHDPGYPLVGRFADGQVRVHEAEKVTFTSTLDSLDPLDQFPHVPL